MFELLLSPLKLLSIVQSPPFLGPLLFSVFQKSRPGTWVWIEVFEVGFMSREYIKGISLNEWKCGKIEGRLLWKKTESARNRKGRKTACWQIVWLLSRYQNCRKNSFPKTRLLPIFPPDFISWHLARFGCFALKSGFVRKLGTFIFLRAGKFW